MITRILFLVALSTTAFSQSLETVIQKGHDQSVLAVTMSPDSNYVATGSRDKSAKLWELSTGREVRSFLGHEGSVNCIDFTRDGKLMITSSGDQTARIWDVMSGKEIFATPAAGKILTAVAFSPDQKYFVVAGYPDAATIWELSSKKLVKEIKVNADQGGGYGINLSFSPDGKYLAIGEDNRIANLYLTGTWEKAFTFNHESGWCGGCATWTDFSNDSRYLLMASNKAPVKRYDLSAGTEVKRYTENIEELSGLSFSPDNNTVMAATKDEVIIWDAQTGSEQSRYKPETGAEINEVTYTADGKRLLLACANNITYAFDLRENRIVSTLSGILNERDKGGIAYDPNSYWESHIAKYLRLKNQIMLSRDGKSLIKGKFGTKVKRWDIATGKTEMDYVGHEKAAMCYELSKDGTRMLTGGGDGRVILWDVATGDTLKVIKAHREPIFDIHFNADETKAITGSWDATAKMIDLATGKTLEYFDFDNASAYSLLLSNNDLYLFAAQLDNTLKMREIDTKKVVRDFVGHSDVISSIRLSADGKQLLSASWDGSIRLWDIATGLMDGKLAGHRGPVYVAIYGQDGKTVFSGGADRMVRVWDIASGKVTRQLTGHQAEVTSIIQSADGKMLISHSTDGVTKFWDLASGQEFFEHIHLGDRDWMVKTREGYFNGTDGARKSVHFVDGMKTYAVDQFFNEFYRPDILPKVFKTRGESTEGKSLQGKLNTSPPPTVRVAAVKTNDPETIDVYVRMTDNGAGVSRLRMFHNGKNIPVNTNELKLPSRKGESTTYKQTVKLVGGSNTLSASATNNDGVESDAPVAEVFSDYPSKNSVCHLLAVGINTYKNSRLSLNYAKPDAESFSTVMTTSGQKLFKSVSLHTLYDEDATRDKILAKLDELAQVINQEDVFIFYYAGHGSMVENQFYFIPTESSRLYDQKALQKEAIEASLLQDRFKHIRALKQLIVMDACQSGGSVELLATRGAGEEKAIAQLSRSAGIHVMASAGSEQFATEFAEIGHGLFTYVLIQALKGEADGAPKDGKVTIYELKSYIDDQVPEMTRKLKGKPQYPYTFSRGQDFPVILDE